MQEIQYKAVIVAGAKGGRLDIVSPEGEIVDTLHVPPGRHMARQFLDLVEPGYELLCGDGCVCFPPRHGVSHTVHPEALQSDANPDFTPTASSRLEREMRIELNEMRAARLALQRDARIAQAGKIEVPGGIPDAKRDADGEVVEGASE